MAKYYDVRHDLERFPDAWLIMVLSKRGPGKTYSTLRYMIEEKVQFVFLKRTIDDVKNLCASDGGDLDLSPFKPLNRDFGWDIHPKLIQKGVAGFYDCSGETQTLVGYCLAANMAKKFKGFDLSDVDYMIFDEFIPRPWEKIHKKEGDMILDLYETIARDRVKRGRKELIFICLANAVEVNNPLCKTMDLVDILADMDVTETEITYMKEKGIFIRILNSNFDVDEDTQLTGIQRAMAGTQWAASAYGAHFSYNDFTAIGKQKLKGFKCLYRIIYNLTEYYVYRKGTQYFVAKVQGSTDKTYDLTRENQQKLFWDEEGFYLREAAIEDKVIFGDYTSYNLITNYRKEFTL